MTADVPMMLILALVFTGLGGRVLYLIMAMRHGGASNPSPPPLLRELEVVAELVSAGTESIAIVAVLAVYQPHIVFCILGGLSLLANAIKARLYLSRTRPATAEWKL